MDFVLVESTYEKVPELLVESVQGFRDSPEFELLHESERNVPGLVCAAFTHFWARFQMEELKSVLTPRDVKTLDDCYEAIDVLSALDDDRVRTLVEDEVFDNVRGDRELWRAIEARLGPDAGELLAQWKLKRATQ